MAQQKKQNLISSAGVLVASTILVKIIGAIYKIPLGNLIGATGNGYFVAAYEIYTPIYTISMAGLPIAVSRLVSENIADGRIRQAQQVYRVSRRLFPLVGAFGTILLFLVAYPYSNYLIKTPQNFISIIAIAPCVFFCCMMSSYRGFYEGTRNMYPTGISQVIEALGKVVFGLTLSYITMKYGLYTFNKAEGQATVFGTLVSNEQEALSAIYPYAAAAAILGVTLGSVCGLIYLFIRDRFYDLNDKPEKKKTKKKFIFTREEVVNSPEPLSSKETAMQLIRIAIPIALSSMVLTVSNFIDSVMIKNRLAYAMQIGGDIIRNMYASSIAVDKVIDADIPTYLYGAYGFALNVKNLIPTITMSLGVSIIPILAAEWSQKRQDGIKHSIESALRLTMLIGMPASFGIAALATPIIDLLYGSNNPGAVSIAGPILMAYGLPIFMYALSSPLTNMLNAVDKMKEPLKAVAIGSVIKIGLNLVLIANPEININGAPISTFACYLFITVYCLYKLLKTAKVKINVVSVFIKPLISGALCGGTAYLAYFVLSEKIAINAKISTLCAVCAGGAIYFISLLLIKGFAREDIEMLPKGEKIAKVLEKLKLLG
ncbi:MAG: polysaccharide biosynthesis C-terminal domain-containing protein [Acutalibacteraceae bacterium]